MLHLDTAQYRFLIQLSKTDKIMCSDMTKSEISVAHFLSDSGLVNVDRESFPRLDPQAHKVEYTYGKWLSVSINESGKAYIAERKTIKREKIWENVRYFITTAIALAAFIKSFFF